MGDSLRCIVVGGACGACKGCEISKKLVLRRVQEMTRFFGPNRMCFFIIDNVYISSFHGLKLSFHGLLSLGNRVVPSCLSPSFQKPRPQQND